MNTVTNDQRSISLPGTQAQDHAIEQLGFIRRHRSVLFWTAISTLVLCALIIVWLKFSNTTQSIDRAQLTIATVERGNFVRDIVADGQVVASVSPTLYASATGIVNLRMHAGDAVTKGQILAVINNPELVAKLAQEQTKLLSLRNDWQHAKLEAEQKLREQHEAYRQAEVDQQTAQRDLDRSLKAYELGSYSELQKDQKQDQLAKAQFAFDRAKANYESQPEQNRFDVDSKQSLLKSEQYVVTDLNRQINDLNVRSPVDGQVGQVQITDRASVARDAPLLTVVDLSALEVQIKVPESLAHDLKPGMTGDIEVDGRHWSGVINTVAPEVVDGQVIARLRFANAAPVGLRQSQRMSVRIFIERRDGVLMVDRGSFVSNDGGKFAYVVHGNVADRQPVRLGATSVSKVEILQGLKAGDQIVISGMDAFNDDKHIILSH